jgi:hypothetical protein
MTTTTATTLPAWLPPIVPFHGDWTPFIKALHALFSIDFKSGTLRFRGCPVWYDRCVLRDDPLGFEEGFWHLVTRDSFVWNPAKRCKEKQRLPDIERARHLRWGRPAIEHETEPELLVWDFDDETPRGKIVRTYLWLKELDYAVILERQAKEKGDVFMLITTFLVDVPAKRVDLESRYQRRKK